MTAAGRPAAVLLHGVGLDRTMWDGVVELLDAAGVDARAVDLLGHGDAPPAETGTTLADLAGAVAAQLRPGTHVVGFSLGALVAQRVAVDRPDLVASLACVSSVCARTPAEREAVEARLATATADLAASADAAIERWFAGTDVPAATRREIHATLVGNDPASYLACYTVFARADAEIAPRLAEIGAPTLAMTGGDDPGSTPEMSHRLARAVPDCDVVVLDGVRHMLPIEAPDALVAALTHLIARASREGES